MPWRPHPPIMVLHAFVKLIVSLWCLIIYRISCHLSVPARAVGGRLFGVQVSDPEAPIGHVLPSVIDVVDWSHGHVDPSDPYGKQETLDAAVRAVPEDLVPLLARRKDSSLLSDRIPAVGDMAMVCPDGWSQEGDRCVIRVVREPMISCPIGSLMTEGGTCEQADYTPPDLVCPAMFDVFMRGCIKRVRVPPSARCPPGSTQHGEICLRETELHAEAQCPAGFLLTSDYAQQDPQKPDLDHLGCVRYVSLPASVMCPVGGVPVTQSLLRHLREDFDLAPDVTAALVAPSCADCDENDDFPLCLSETDMPTGFECAEKPATDKAPASLTKETATGKSSKKPLNKQLEGQGKSDKTVKPAGNAAALKSRAVSTVKVNDGVTQEQSTAPPKAKTEIKTKQITTATPTAPPQKSAERLDPKLEKSDAAKEKRARSQEENGSNGTESAPVHVDAKLGGKKSNSNQSENNEPKSGAEGANAPRKTDKDLRAKSELNTDRKSEKPQKPKDPISTETKPEKKGSKSDEDNKIKETAIDKGQLQKNAARDKTTLRPTTPDTTAAPSSEGAEDEQKKSRSTDNSESPLAGASLEEGKHARVDAIDGTAASNALSTPNLRDRDTPRGSSGSTGAAELISTSSTTAPPAASNSPRRTPSRTQTPERRSDVESQSAGGVAASPPATGKEKPDDTTPPPQQFSVASAWPDTLRAFTKLLDTISARLKPGGSAAPTAAAGPSAATSTGAFVDVVTSTTPAPFANTPASDGKAPESTAVLAVADTAAEPSGQPQATLSAVDATTGITASSSPFSTAATTAMPSIIAIGGKQAKPTALPVSDEVAEDQTTDAPAKTCESAASATPLPAGGAATHTASAAAATTSTATSTTSPVASTTVQGRPYTTTVLAQPRSTVADGSSSTTASVTSGPSEESPTLTASSTAQNAAAAAAASHETQSRTTKSLMAASVGPIGQGGLSDQAPAKIAPSEGGSRNPRQTDRLRETAEALKPTMCPPSTQEQPACHEGWRLACQGEPWLRDAHKSALSKELVDLASKGKWAPSAVAAVAQWLTLQLSADESPFTAAAPISGKPCQKTAQQRCRQWSVTTGLYVCPPHLVLRPSAGTDTGPLCEGQERQPAELRCPLSLEESSNLKCRAVAVAPLETRCPEGFHVGVQEDPYMRPGQKAKWRYPGEPSVKPAGNPRPTPAERKRNRAEQQEQKTAGKRLLYARQEVDWGADHIIMLDGLCERVEYAEHQTVCPLGYELHASKAGRGSKKTCAARKAVPPAFVCEPGFLAEEDESGNQICVKTLAAAPTLVSEAYSLGFASAGAVIGDVSSCVVTPAGLQCGSNTRYYGDVTERGVKMGERFQARMHEKAGTLVTPVAAEPDSRVVRSKATRRIRITGRQAANIF